MSLLQDLLRSSLLALLCIISQPAHDAALGDEVLQIIKEGGTGAIHTGSGDIHIGITLEAFESGLKRREKEVEERLTQVHSNERKQYRETLKTIQERLQNLEQSYQDHIKDLRARISQVETMRGQISDELLNQAKSALVRGDSGEADQLFQQVEAQTAEAITVAAEAAYQRCQIAADDINYRKANSLCQRAVQLVPENSVYISGQAKLAYMLGQYREAIDYYERVLASNLKMYGEDHPNVATDLNNLANLYQIQGQYALAKLHHERSLYIREKTFDSEHPDVAQSINNLANLYQAQGQYAHAEPLYKRALKIREKILGLEHPDVAQSMNSLANLFQAQGQYTQAELFYKRALKIREKILSLEHPDVAQSINNLANLFQVQGQYAQAELLYKRALKIRGKILGPDHPDVAKSMNNLANLYRIQGHYPQAELLYKQSLDIYGKTFDSDHPDVAQSMNDLANFYQVQRRYAQAEPLYKRALKIREKILGPDHPDVAQSMNNLANFYQAQGQYVQAEPLYKRSLAIYKNALGQDHPYVAAGLINSSIYLWAIGDMAEAVTQAQNAITIREHHLARFLVKGSEDEKHAYMATIEYDTQFAISLQLAAGSGNLTATRLALTTLLQRKGRILDAISDDVASLRERLSEQDRALLDQLAATRSQQSSLYNLSQQSKIVPELYHREMAKLIEEAQALETKISSHSAEFKTKAQPITLKGIQQAVPRDAALVEFAAYHPINPKAQKDSDQLGAARYIAYVLKPQGEPLSIELGEAVDIDSRISELRNALSDPYSDLALRVARRLDEQLMQPIRMLLGETKTVFLSPDGALNLLPFGALVDENNEYLIKHYAFTYLSSGRDLLRLQTKVVSKDQDTIIADVDYGNVDNLHQTINDVLEPRNRDLNSFVLGKFMPLPGTAKEADGILKILPAAKVLRGKEATEYAIKKLNSPRILHVATQGFFIPDLRVELKVMRGLQSLDGSVQMPITENPLLRSGLALANANQLESADEDGVLTALEVSSLNLWGTQLVVLSACETGLGDLQNGEGVFGLRRALVIAGSESQVLSLWKIDDLATTHLMVDYYRRLITLREGRSEALRQAQLIMLSDPNHQHPFYWAGFIHSGNWMRLD